MGHRALLAYRRDDSLDSDPRYDLHRSHWGGADFALADRISAETPFAADSQFAVDPDPVATDRSLGEVAAEHVDFLHHEAFYRVAADYETTPFHVWWFGLEADCEAVSRSETVGHGALIEAHENADYLRGWFRGTKSVVGDAVDGDGPSGADASPSDAADYLVERAETWSENRTVILSD